MSRPSADVSVRVAWTDDADAIAALQVRAWQSSYDGLLPAAALEIDPAKAAALWRTTLAQPKDARTRVLVALERNRVVGFAITTPATDPDCNPASDAELMELTVDPGERGRGPRVAAGAGRRRDDGGRPVHPGGAVGGGHR